MKTNKIYCSIFHVVHFLIKIIFLGNIILSGKKKTIYPNIFLSRNIVEKLNRYRSPDITII